MSQLGDSTISLLSRALDVSLQRQTVINSNVVNLDTPGFTPQDVDFDSALADVAAGAEIGLARTDGTHVSASSSADGSIRTFERADGEPGPDGNAVDIDVQMARMAQNAILYQATTRAVSKKLALLKYVASDGSLG